MTRGEASNNPGNIRLTSTMWEGESALQADPDFVQFTDVKWGIRAIARILQSYEREGIDTLQEAIERWAPRSENDTEAYLSDVCQRCEISPTQVIQLSSCLLPIISAIIVHENGSNPYTVDQINEGISLS